MSDIYPPSPSFQGKAHFSSLEEYQRGIRALDSRSGSLVGGKGRHLPLVREVAHRARLQLRPRQGPDLDPVVRRRPHQHRLQLSRPAPRDPRRPGRHHLGGERAGRGRHPDLPGAARAGLQVRQRPQVPGGEAGRPRLHLPADGSRARRRHARLRPHRRRPLHRLRRLLRRLAVRPHRRFHLHHRRDLQRHPPRRQADPDEARSPTPPWPPRKRRWAFRSRPASSWRGSAATPGSRSR